jgi:hypothetical protein
MNNKSGYSSMSSRHSKDIRHTYALEGDKLKWNMLNTID